MKVSIVISRIWFDICLKNCLATFLCRYGVNDMEESAKKIYEAAIGTPEEHFVIFLAHNGPTGFPIN